MMFCTLVVVTLFLGCYSDHVSKRQLSDNSTVVRVVSIKVEPFLTINKDGEYEGFIPDLVHELAEYIDVQCDIQLVKDGQYGIQQSDGTWNGMIGELVRAEADMIVAPLTITAVRERVVDFCKPFMSAGITTLFKKPTSKHFAVLWLFKPFDIEVWFLLLVVTAVFCVLLYLLKRFGSKPQENDDSGCSSESRKLCVAVSRIMGIQKDQSAAVSVLMITWRMFFFFTAALYISALITFTATTLTSSQVHLPFANVEELADLGIPVGCVGGGSTHEFFKLSTIPTYERIYKRVSKESSEVSTTKEGLQKVKDGNFALLGESPILEYEAQRDCDLVMVGGNLNSVGYGVATPLGSKYRDLVSLAILRLRENGVIQKLHQKWWKHMHKGKLCSDTAYKGSSGSDSAKPEPVAINLHEFGHYGSLILLVIGLGLTVVVAVAEKIVQPTDKETVKTGSDKEENCAETVA